MALIVAGAFAVAPTALAEPAPIDENVEQEAAGEEAQSGTSDDSTEDPAGDQQGGTDKCVDTDSCMGDKQPEQPEKQPQCEEFPEKCDPKQPECEENCEPEVPECEENCEPEVPECVEGLDCDPDPCVIDPATCIDFETDCEVDPLAEGCEEDTLGQEAPPTGGGNQLPFTGINDFMFPVALGFMMLIAGAMMFQYASLQDALGAIRSSELARRTRSGFGEAMKKLK